MVNESRNNNIWYVLVDETFKVLITIRGVPLREKLVGVPHKVDVQRGHEKRCRR